MIRLNLNEFSSYDSKDVYKFLMLQQENDFEIRIPKSTHPFKNERFDVFWEYLVMAYTGQKLYDISSELSYNVPDAMSKQPFKFIVKINDLEELADLIYELIAVLQEDDPEDTTAEFQIAASTFFIDAYDPKVIPKTWGLLYAAHNFLPS